MEERIKRIIENSSSLSDKEYIDMYVKLQAGRIQAQQKPAKVKNEFCIFPIPENERERILKIVTSSEDMLLYFVKIGGLKMIKDSFDHDDFMLQCLEEILKNQKQREEF